MGITVTGLPQLHARLRALGEDIEKKVARSATGAAARVIKDIAFGKASVSPPLVSPDVPPGFTLKHNIIVRYINPQRSGVTSMHVVTVRKRNAKFPTVSPYRVGVFNEFGTVKMSPRAFMRPAFQQGRNSALDAMTKRLAARIRLAERSGK